MLGQCVPTCSSRQQQHQSGEASVSTTAQQMPPLPTCSRCRNSLMAPCRKRTRRHPPLSLSIGPHQHLLQLLLPPSQIAAQVGLQALLARSNVHAFRLAGIQLVLQGGAVSGATDNKALLAQRAALHPCSNLSLMNSTTTVSGQKMHSTLQTSGLPCRAERIPLNSWASHARLQLAHRQKSNSLPVSLSISTGQQLHQGKHSYGCVAATSTGKIAGKQCSNWCWLAGSIAGAAADHPREQHRKCARTAAGLMRGTEALQLYTSDACWRPGYS